MPSRALGEVARRDAFDHGVVEAVHLGEEAPALDVLQVPFDKLVECILVVGRHDLDEYVALS